MTEEIKPKGTPYGLAMGLLHEFAESLPRAVVLLPDHVLWPSDSLSLSAQTFQMLDEAAAVLSALHAQHIPLALLVPAQSSKVVKSCLEDTKLLSQFAAVVEYQTEPQQEPPAQAAQQEQQQQPSAAATAAGIHHNWMEAATAVKAVTGVPWQQTLLFCPAAAVEAARLANKLGMACVRVPAASGLNVSCLRSGLETYSSKLEGDRGY